MLQRCPFLLAVSYSLFSIPHLLFPGLAWRKTDAAAPPPGPTRFRECATRGEKPQDWLAALRKKSLPSEGEAGKEFLKLTERSGNVYENKGPLWKSRARSWNLYENKGAYLI
jgi:hypothetical protein